jgi:hypothetical protein
MGISIPNFSLRSLADYGAFTPQQWVQGAQQTFMPQTLAELGTQAAQGDYAGAARTAFAGGNPDVGEKMIDFGNDQRDKMAKFASSIAQQATTPVAWQNAGKAFQAQFPGAVWPSFDQRDAVVASGIAPEDQITNRFKQAELANDANRNFVAMQSYGGDPSMLLPVPGLGGYASSPAQPSTNAPPPAGPQASAAPPPMQPSALPGAMGSRFNADFGVSGANGQSAPLQAALQQRFGVPPAGDQPQPAVPQASATPLARMSGPEQIAQAVVVGQQPPDLRNLGMRWSGPVRAALARAGYDLTKAQMDYAGTTARIRSMNGAQQIRLRQAIGAMPDMLDKIEGLGQQWQASGRNGQFPILNRANLTLARNGAYGQQAQQIAVQLDAEIADVSADLATIYRGGNTATDAALEHADQQFSSDWSWPTLKAGLDLARANIRYRQNSLNLVGAGSADNPYDVNAPAAVGATAGGTAAPAPGAIYDWSPDQGLRAGQ